MRKEVTIGTILMLVSVGMLSGCTTRSLKDFPKIVGIVENIERFESEFNKYGGISDNDCRVTFSDGRIFEFVYDTFSFGNHSNIYWYNFIARNKGEHVEIYYREDGDIGISYTWIYEVLA